LNKEGIDGGCGGVVLAIDSLLRCSPLLAAVFVAAAAANEQLKESQEEDHKRKETMV
jgi:hypothetical protein